MPTRFYVPRDDILAYQADEWEQTHLTKVADQWERNALQRLDEQYAPPQPAAPVQPTADPADFLKQQQQRLGWSSGAEEVSQPFGQATEHVERLTSQVNPAIAPPAPEPEPTPAPAPVASPPDLRSLNTTGEQYTPPSEAAPAPATQAPTPGGSLVDYARQTAQRAGIDPDQFVRQINQESGFQTRAQSGAGARGIAQIVPRFHPGVNPDNPTEALDYAANLMASHKKTYGSDELALVAYNGGQGAVNAWQAGRPYGESQQYVSRILGGAGGPTPTGAGTAATPQNLDTVPRGTAGDISQFGDPQLSAAEANAACGPAAAVRFAQRFGRNPTLREALDLAGSVGWTAQQGMAGLGSQKALMDKLGVETQLVSGPRWDKFAQEAQTGNPVTISTSAHYFYADGYNPETGAFHVGKSGTDLRGGKEWMTQDEIVAAAQRLGGGNVQGALLASNPTVPAGTTARPTEKSIFEQAGDKVAEVTGQPRDLLDTWLDEQVAKLDTAVASSASKGARQEGSLEQITNPFGEAFRQAGLAVSDVGGGALDAVRGATEPFTSGLQEQQGIADELRRQAETERLARQTENRPYNPLEQVGESVIQSSDEISRAPGQLYGADVATGQALSAAVVDSARQAGWAPEPGQEQFVRNVLAQATPSNVLLSVLTTGQSTLARTLVQGAAELGAGAVGSELARQKAEEAGWPEWAQSVAQVAGGVGGGITGALGTRGAIRAAESPAVQAAIRSGLPAEAEAGFAAGLPTGGRGGAPDVAVPPEPSAGPRAATPLTAVQQGVIQSSPNYRRLEAMRGTAEQQAALRPEEAGFAANLNLEKIATSDADATGEIRTVLRQIAAEQAQFAGQRRGVITDVQARENAAAKALTMSAADWIKTPAGRAFNQEEALALGNQLVKSTDEYVAMKAALDAAETAGKATDLERLAVADKMMELSLLEGVRSGATAEGGRAMRGFRQVLDGAMRGKADTSQALRAAYKVLGGQEAYQKWTQAWSQIPNDGSAAATQARYQLLQALHRPSLLQYLTAWTTSNMLSSGKTMETNAFGGAVETVNRPLITLLGGRPIDAATDVGAMFGAVGEAWARGSKAFSTGIRQSDAERIVADPDQWDAVRPEVFGGKLGVVATPALRIAGATDEFIRTINSAGAMAVAARREGKAAGKTAQELLASPTEGMLKYAEDAANASVFQGTGTFVSRGIARQRNRLYQPGFVNRSVGAGMHVLFPFVRIPETILLGGTKMLAGPLGEMKPLADALRSGDSHAARDAGARATLTTSLLGYIGYQIGQGNITGEGPSDPQRRKALEAARDANGNKIWQRNSVRVGDQWFDYTNIGRVAVPMAVMANAYEQYLENGKKIDPDLAANTFGSTANTILSASFLESAGDLAAAISDRDGDQAAKAFGSLANNTASRFVPYGGALAQITRATDQNVKEPRNTAEYVASRIPVLSQLVPNRADVFGGDVQAPQSAMSNLSPWRQSAPGVPEPVAEAYVNAGMGAPTIPTEITVRGATGNTSPPIKLTKDEQVQWTRYFGDVLESSLREEVQKPGWATQSVADQRKYLQAVADRARQAANTRMFNELPPDEQNKRMAEGRERKTPQPIPR